MPSFKVSNTANKHTFGHFYTSFIELFKDQDNVNISANVLILSIIKMAIICIVMTVCVFTIAFGWTFMLYFDNYKLYEKYQLYYLFDGIWYVIFPFFSLLCISHIFLNGYYNYSLKHSIIQTFVVCVLINGTIISLLYWQLHEYNNYIWYWKWICNNLMINQPVFQLVCTINFSLVGLYSAVFGYPLCLLLIVVLNYLMSILFRNERLTKKDSLHNNFSQSSRIEMSGQDLNQSLVNTVNTVNTTEDQVIRGRVIDPVLRGGYLPF